MTDLNKHIVYFIGIGGIGMSALARWFKAKGHEVLGYDRTPTVLTGLLQEEGIDVHFDDSIENIPTDSNPDNTLVIFTPAVPKEHQQLNYFLNNGFTVKKRSQVLGDISRNYYTVAVAGTHGKTTTSSMIAHLLHFAGIDTAAFLGGIATNFNSNLLIGQTDKAIAVVEADEFDRSFLQLTPNIEVVTSTDPDHLDIYGDTEHMHESFRMFVGQLSKPGHLLVSSSVDPSVVTEDALVYGLENATITASNIRATDRYIFDFTDGDVTIKDVELGLPGFHNTENAIAAMKVALLLGVEPDTVKKGVASYAGVKRRFEYVLRDGIIYIDDYAHHPEELRSFLSSVKVMYPEKVIKVIFQPHLYSRTNDFKDGFARSLDIADEVILMDIYPARELPIPGVTSEMIGGLMATPVKVMSREEIIEDLKNNKPEVLATLGAGDIDKLVPEIKDVLIKSYMS